MFSDGKYKAYCAVHDIRLRIRHLAEVNDTDIFHRFQVILDTLKPYSTVPNPHVICNI